MKPVGRRARRCAFLGAAVGTAMGSLLWYLAQPFHFLDSDKAYVFLGPSCGYADPIVTQLERDPDLASRVVPVMAEAEPGPLSDRICKLAAADFKARLPWLRLASDPWVCERLQQWSVAAYTRSFIKIPSWSVGDELVDWRGEQAALGELGLRLDLPDRARPIKRLDEPSGADANAQPERPSPDPDTAKGNDEHWRGLGIGY